MKYLVTCLTDEGKIEKLTIDANSEDEVLRTLSDRKVTVLEIRKPLPIGIFLNNLEKKLRKRKLGLREVADFCFYVGRSIEIGVPILSVLEDLKKISKDPLMVETIDRIITEIQSGNSLSEAIKRTGVFPSELTGLVKLGESTDALPQILLNYAEFLDWRGEIDREIKQALSYPIFVTFVLIITIGIMFGFIIPQILPVIKALGLKEYPLPTKILLWSGYLVKNFWIEILSFPFLVFFLVKVLLKSKKLKLYLDMVKLKLPLIGEIILKASLSKDIRTLAEVYRSGGSLLIAVDIIINDLEKNLFLQNIFSQIKNNLISGFMLSKAFEKTQFFENQIVRMIKLGEDTGTLDKSLMRLVDIYQDEMRKKIRSLVVLIEPTLQLFLGGILGILALGILLPVYNVISMIR